MNIEEQWLSLKRIIHTVIPGKAKQPTTLTETSIDSKWKLTMDAETFLVAGNGQNVSHSRNGKQCIKVFSSIDIIFCLSLLY